MKSKKLIIFILYGLATAAIAAPPGGTVLLDEQGVRNLGIETVIVEDSDFEVTTFAPGWTMAIPENRSVLSSRISGRVVENRIEIGEFVEKGDKLLRIESRQPGDPPPSIWLTAPADGNILKMNTLLGAPVDPTNSLAEIADLRRLYLIVTMPQSTGGKVAQGTKARVRFPLRPDKEYTAALRQQYEACALGLEMSAGNDGREKSINTAGMVFTIENEDGQLRPEMYAECSVIMESRSGVLGVPREAVHGGPDERHVYIRHHRIPHAFDRLSVKTGASGNGRVEILDGLFAGDEVVTRGSYSLGFAGNSGGNSLKDAMDAAHGHEHNEDGSEITDGQQADDDHPPHDDDHDHPHIELRELIFMASTAILAVALIVVMMRRRKSSASITDLS